MINNNEKEFNPYILIQGKYNSITMNRDIVRCLDYPEYICLRTNPKNNSMAIMPCNENDDLSFKVPEKFMFDNHTNFRVTSKQFINDVQSRNNLEDDAVYCFTGIFYKQLKAVIISLNEDNKIKCNYTPRPKKIVD